MNLNQFAKEVTIEEGKKVNLSIAQVKEVLKIILKKLSRMSIKEIADIFKMPEK